MVDKIEEKDPELGPDPETAWKLPAKFRISAKNRDKKQEDILAAADAQQAEWSERFAQPGSMQSPQERERARALIIIDEYTSIGVNFLTNDQLADLADRYAAIGRYDEAYRYAPSKELKKEYFYIFAAIQRDDDKMCKCGTGSQFAKKDIWSIFHDQVVSLVKCGKCGHLNARPTPDHISEARAVRARIRAELTGLHPLEAKKRMQEMRENGEIA